MISVFLLIMLHCVSSSFSESEIDVKNTRTFLYVTGLKKLFDSHRENIENIMENFRLPQNATLIDELKQFYIVIRNIYRVLKGRQFKVSERLKRAVLSLRPHFDDLNYSTFRLKYHFNFNLYEIKEFRKLYAKCSEIFDEIIWFFNHKKPYS